MDPNESGTLYFRNGMGSDFEYHKSPEKTAEAHLEPGVFTTGDVGYLDDEGYMWLSDRKIDMIISGGVNIYPAEIEGVLGGHPLVGDVCVIGVPNEEFGEEIKAIVVPNDGVEASDELIATLAAHCRDQMGGLQVPALVRLHRRPAPHRHRQDPEAQASRSVLGRHRPLDLSVSSGARHQMTHVRTHHEPTHECRGLCRPPSRHHHTGHEPDGRRGRTEGSAIARMVDQRRHRSTSSASSTTSCPTTWWASGPTAGPMHIWPNGRTAPSPRSATSGNRWHLHSGRSVKRTRSWQCGRGPT